MCRSWIFATLHYTDTHSYILVPSMVRLPSRGLPSPNCHSHGLTSWTLLPRRPSVAAVSAQPYGKPESLRFLNMWGIVGVELPARNNGIERNSAHHILDICHVEAGGWGWFIQLDHSSVLHRPLDRQFELFKGIEENQGVYYVIRAGFVGSVFRQSSILWPQNAREEKLGTGIPAVLQGNIVSFSSMQKGLGGTTSMVSCTQKYSTSQYVPIQTMIYNVYLSTYFNIQGISGYILAWDIAKCLANRWIEGMKAPLRHIKWITSGTHCTPEQLRLPFHTLHKPTDI